MKTFFIFYWLTFFAGWWTVRSYQNHLRFAGRQVHAERHRRRLEQARRYGPSHGDRSTIENPRLPQLHLFE